MAVYVVTWNLNKEGWAYGTARAALMTLIDAYDNRRDHNLESVVWVSTNLPVSEVRAHLMLGLDVNDGLFISRVRDDEKDGFLDPATWNWISARA